VRAKDRRFIDALMPGFGFLICLLLWLNLSRPAMLAGSLWMAAGILFGAWKTRGFRSALVDFDYQDLDDKTSNPSIA
jgi:hypothetical protein